MVAARTGGTVGLGVRAEIAVDLWHGRMSHVCPSLHVCEYLVGIAMCLGLSGAALG